ncbi:radical SAM family heme chaperone HemW [Algoriphagus kandeliae]|uniref:radical SAM family heme chaperone HemW n=1 Tax=Algoriphagus kandeliae TaxID=2562278 RepID=UPI002938EDC1|nr:radical SAM family heme chaperone HemW [Algoriphagus kandeliae]
MQIKEFKLAGIYIHIPFCKQACHYCDFHFSTNTSQFQNMTSLIAREAILRKDFLNGESITTIYFGGGTPSLAKPEWLEEILSAIHTNFKLDLQEVTLEANPDDLSPKKLAAWKKLGIDRLSLGIQSFQDEVLQFYNRAHNSKESLEAIEMARGEGFKKFSMDLIYGFPHSDHSLWIQDLKTAISQHPGHLSCYALTVEEGTALGNWTQKGKFNPADEDFVAEQFEILQHLSEEAGYIQYEISNFAQPGQESLHNSLYWKGQSYLGLGPGAHSFDGEQRFLNPSHNPNYIKALSQNLLPLIPEPLEEVDRLNEYLLTALRTRWGVDLEFLQEKFKKDLLNERSIKIREFEQAGWLQWEKKSLSLTKSGMLLADSIAQALFY